MMMHEVAARIGERVLGTSSSSARTGFSPSGGSRRVVSRARCVGRFAALSQEVH